MTDTQQRIVFLVLGLVAVIAFLLSGGTTVAVLNRTPEKICEVYFSYQPALTGWGADRLGGEVPATQSRDIQLPVYFGWFESSRTEGFSGRALNCAGEELAIVTGLDGKLVIWEVR